MDVKRQLKNENYERSVENWAQTHRWQQCDHTGRRTMWRKALTACFVVLPSATSLPRWYYLGITLLDRFLSRTKTIRNEPWDIVLATLQLARECEYQPNNGDGTREYSKIFPYAPSKVRNAREEVLRVLENDLDWPTPLSFVHRPVEPCKGIEPLARTIETIMLVASLAGYVTRFPSHTMAAASCDLARQLLDMEEKVCISLDRALDFTTDLAIGYKTNECRARPQSHAARRVRELLSVAKVTSGLAVQITKACAPSGPWLDTEQYSMLAQTRRSKSAVQISHRPT